MIEKDLDGIGNSPDRPVLRPRPGAGRRPASTAIPIASVGATQPRLRALTDESITGDAGAQITQSAASGAGADFTGDSPDMPPAIALPPSGGNPVLQAAAPLLTFAARTQTTPHQADVQALWSEAMREMQVFRQYLLAAKMSEEARNIASYVVCTFADSAVLSTPWGVRSGWSARSLLTHFHRESVGGAKFFQILEQLRSNPARYIDLIELLGVCLALGFEGKYRLDERGPAKLAELEREVFRLIRDYRPRRLHELSPHWQGAEDTHNPLLRFAPWWVVAAGGLLILVGGFVWFRSQLSVAAASIESALARPAARLEYDASRPSRGTRLHQLREPLERGGVLTVEDLGEKAVVTVVAADLFATGSARVAPAQYATLRRLAAALNRVPGRIMIVGHTDNRPLRSIRFADNFELSRERALAVAEVLRPAIEDFGRVEWSGAGASLPRYLPPDDPDNRARNGRVELILVSAESPG